jgi:hypothetical protein
MIEIGRQGGDGETLRGLGLAAVGPALGRGDVDGGDPGRIRGRQLRARPVAGLWRQGAFAAAGEQCGAAEAEEAKVAGQLRMSGLRTDGTATPAGRRRAVAPIRRLSRSIAAC